MSDMATLVIVICFSGAGFCMGMGWMEFKIANHVVNSTTDRYWERALKDARAKKFRKELDSQ